MKNGTLRIHSENILPIIKKWLYSDKDIFVRELVSNACDAITKLRTLKAPSPAQIDVRIDKTKRTLTFSDQGLGMDSDEVENYIAQIAFSGAEEFLKKYETNKESDQIIGHFGLGFYSAYMVAAYVEIDTLSYKENATAVYWKCDGSSTYTIGEGSRKEVGTDIILTLTEEESEYLEESKIRAILNQNCSFLPHPIFLNGKQINEKPPLWMQAPSECTDKEYIDFYHHLFPGDKDPLFWVHLQVDYPFHLKGILYFPKISQDQELKKETIKLYCNRVFVSDNCKDILPDYLMILKGAIDSSDIPLNVSRSYLQTDRTVQQLGAHVSKKISDKLSSLYKEDKEKFYSYWEDIELIIKYGALQDKKFYERVKEFLVWKNNEEKWTTVEDYLKRAPTKIIYYAPEEKSHAHFLSLYKEKGIEVLFISPNWIDQALIQFLEKETGAQFKRIDADLHDVLLDPTKEKSLLDQDGKSVAAHIADFFRKKLSTNNVEVEAKSFATDTLPAVLTFKEEERRMRDYLALRGDASMKGALQWMKPTFIVNTNNKLVQAIQSFEEKDPKLAESLACALYDLARLSQREMEPDAISQFVTRSCDVLEQLSTKLTLKN